MDSVGSTSLIETYNDRNYAKSNVLITAKYRSSLLENKLFALSLSRIDTLYRDPDKGGLIQEIPVSDIKEALGITGGSIYHNLSIAARHMTNKSIGWTSEDNKTFDYMTIINRAKCEDGVFTIYYNPYIEDYITDFKRNFTVLNLPITLSFSRSVYSMRLYELLRSSCYFQKGEEPDINKVFKVRYDLSELKLILGSVNAENDKVVSVLGGSSHPDYEKAVNATTEKVLDDWRNFRRKVLDRGTEEINEIADIYVEYDTVRQGRGGKVRDVIFKMRFKEDFFVKKYGGKKENSKELSLGEKTEIEEWLSDVVETPLRMKDIRAICEAAEYDKEKIKKANEVLWAYPEKVENVTGFLINAVKKNGYEKVERQGKEKKSKSSMNSFNEFEQREYDYDQLEMQFEDLLLRAGAKGDE